MNFTPKGAIESRVIVLATGLLGFVCLGGPVAIADVQITGFVNISFGTWSGVGDLVQTNDLCVHNSDDAQYQVTATSSGGSFVLQDGGSSVTYKVRFKKAGSAFEELFHGAPSSTINGADTSSANCSGGTNAILEVSMIEADLLASPPGSYSATLSILLEPAP